MDADERGFSRGRIIGDGTTVCGKKREKTTFYLKRIRVHQRSSAVPFLFRPRLSPQIPHEPNLFGQAFLHIELPAAVF
jgi:hypothetical protein